MARRTIPESPGEALPRAEGGTPFETPKAGDLRPMENLFG